MRQIRFLSLASAAICATGFAVQGARADTITFGADTLGLVANGFVSGSSPDVSFSDSGGSRLVVIDATGLGISSNALGINGDDDARLQMTFAGPMSGLSVTFGNDDANYQLAGDRAYLVLYSGAAQVASTFLELNLNSTIDQTISYSGGATFDRADFYFGEVSGIGNLGAEVVSSVSFDRLAVSEPGSLALLGAGLLGLGLVQQRRRAASTEA